MACDGVILDVWGDSLDLVHDGGESDMATSRNFATNLLQRCRQVWTAAVLGWAGAAGAGENVALDITTLYGKKHVFFDGDPVRFFVRTQQDSYVVLIYQSDDTLAQIYPGIESSRLPGKLRAGLYHLLPSHEEGRQWIASEPFGCDKIWAFATHNPPPVLPGRLIGGFKHLDLRLEVVEKILGSDHAFIAKTSLEVCTRPRLNAGWKSAQPHSPGTLSHVHQ